MRFLITLTLIITSLSFSFAQAITKFSYDHKDFAKEVEKMLKGTKRSDCVATAEAFVEAIEEGVLTGNEIDYVITTCNIMLERRMRAFPHFQAYINSLINIQRDAENVIRFEEWQDVMNKVIEDQKRGDNGNFLKYVSVFDVFFKKGQLNTTKNKAYMVTTLDYKINYADKSLEMVFPETNLLIATTGDTIRILNTSGKFYMFEDKWVGGKGKMTWERANLPADKAYCEFDQYEFNVTKGDIKIDSVRMFYPDLFNEALLGELNDKLIVNHDRKKSTLPRFESYRNDLELQNIAPGVRYIGGFQLTGTKVFGGVKDGRAKMEWLHPDGMPLMTAEPKSVTFKLPKDISLTSARLNVMFCEGDTIQHPEADVNYKALERKIRIFKGEKGIGKSRFYNTYHKVEMDIDAIIWSLDSAFVDLQMIEGTGQRPATFESVNAYNEGMHRGLQGIVSYDPLYLVFNHSQKVKAKLFSVESLANTISPRLSVQQMKSLLYQLAEKGFIDYNERLEEVEVREKTFFYVKSGAKRVDFDYIKINSINENRTYARVDLTDCGMNITGVQALPLSEHSNVWVYPAKKNVDMYRGRDMTFDGLMYGGRMDYQGEEFEFSYEKFNVTMNKVDSMKISIPEGTDAEGEYLLDEDNDIKLRYIKSQIENLKGELEVDLPINKSGRADLLMFPRMKSEEISNIFYDKTMNGVYDRKRFMYNVDPFEFDSLNVIPPEDIKFEGELNSGGIFETFRQNVKIQPDLALGFKRVTPENGFSAYGGAGTYTDSLTLDLKGLRGKGKLNYISANMSSENFTFFLDSTKALLDTFEMAQSNIPVSTPQASSSGNKMMWDPYNDFMDVKMNVVPFSMYNGQSELLGDLRLSNSGITGNGNMDWEEATLTSDLFNLKAVEFGADTSALSIKSAGDPNIVAYSAPNVSSSVNFETRKGNFVSNIPNMESVFEVTKYKTIVDEFDWDMDSRMLNFKAPEGSDGRFYTSIHPDQDSLKFKGKSAEFSLETNILKITDVTKIVIADSKVLPSSGEVVIHPNAQMQTLTDAQLITDTANERHLIERATIDITGKNALTGTGYHMYKSGNMAGQEIALSEIGVAKTIKGDTTDKKANLQTMYNVYAKGNISPDQEFKIYNNVKYQGNVNLASQQTDLDFNGYAKVEFQNPNVESEWFSFKQPVTKDSVRIDIGNNLSLDGKEVTVGIHAGRDELGSMYSNLLGAKKLNSDADVFSVKGEMRYDDMSNEYTFGEKEVLDGKKAGKKLTYDDTRGKIKAQGKLDLGLKTGGIKISSAGTIESDVNKGTFIYDLMLTMDLKIDPLILQDMGYYMYNDNFESGPNDYSTEEFENRLMLMVDKAEQAPVKKQLQETGVFTRPKSITEKLVFTKVKLVYDPVDNVFRSVGRLGMAFFGTQEMHIEVPGYLEIGYGKGQDKFELMLQTSLGDFMHFAYDKNNLRIISNYDQINTKIRQLDPTKRRITNKADGSYYIYSLNSASKATAFEKKMKKWQATQK